MIVPGWSEYFMGIADAVSRRAKCVRRQVGAVLVDEDHRIISTGYNGAPSGLPECIQGACPRGRLSYDEVAEFSNYDAPASPGYCIAIHAEANAILTATKSARSTTGSTMYVNHKPCPSCTKLLAGAGVSLVVWPGGMDHPDKMMMRGI